MPKKISETSSQKKSVDGDNTDSIVTFPGKKKDKTSVVPKEPILLVADLGRSSCKFFAYKTANLQELLAEKARVSKLTSCLVKLKSAPDNDYGGFSLVTEHIKYDESGLAEQESYTVKNKKTGGEETKLRDKKYKITEHWIVGDRASAYPGHFYLTDDGQENAKVDFFHVLLMGVIASLPGLEEDFSTGKSPTSKSLTIDLATLSIASGAELRQKLKQCKHLVVKGVKYHLNFTSKSYSFYEGHGSAFLAKKIFDSQTCYIADLGAGTFQVAEFDIVGRLPSKKSADLYFGGGGVSSLKEEVARSLANRDSSRYVSYSQAGVILESSAFEDETKSVKAEDFYRVEVGDRIEMAINKWLRESPAGFALSSLIVASRHHPIIFCGGGFAISSVRGIIQKRIIESGGNPDNLIFPSDVGTVGITGVLEFLKPQEANAAATTEKESVANELPRSNELNNRDSANSTRTENATDVLVA